MAEFERCFGNMGSDQTKPTETRRTCTLPSDVREIKAIGVADDDVLDGAKSVDQNTNGTPDFMGNIGQPRRDLWCHNGVVFRSAKELFQRLEVRSLETICMARDVLVGDGVAPLVPKRLNGLAVLVGIWIVGAEFEIAL